MSFGEREEMLELAKKLLAEVQKTYPNASLADADSVNTIFLLMDAPEKYHESVIARRPDRTLDRKQLLAGMLGPLRRSIQRSIQA